MWPELAVLHEAAPRASWQDLLPRLRFKTVGSNSKTDPRLLRSASALERVSLPAAPAKLVLVEDGVRYRIRVESLSGRVVLIEGGY